MKEIIKRLEQEYPDSRISLNFRNAYELLVVTILSAQSTDKKVNEISPVLFEKYKDALALARASLEDIETIIKPTGFFRQKSKYISGVAKMISERFGGNVPDTMEELMQLPGVARKTANIVLGNAFGKVEGIAVDTHVKRLSKLLGFTKNSDPDKIEQDLMKVTPKESWFKLSYLLIDHGREVCQANRPKCEICILKDICPSARVAGARS